MINSVEEYLDQLRWELAGSDPATIEDALADSEEYLRNALESDPDLQSVIEDYGSPEEIAANYRDLEGRGAALAGTAASGRPGEQGSPPRTYSPFWIVFGSVIVFFSFLFVITGGAVLWANAALTDDDGYFMTDSVRLSGGSHAIISEPAEIEMGVARAFDLGFIDAFRGEVENRNPATDIFVGVAREEDLAAYLATVPYERITEIRIENNDWETEIIPGTTQPAPPTAQTFWEQSAQGEGTQVLSWEPETGTWVFVIMNADGSPGIDVSAKVGARIPWLFAAAFGTLVVGILGLVIGVLLIIFAGTRRSGSGTGAGASEA